MIRIIGIAGSLRQGSYNAALLRNAVELAPAGCKLEIATIKDIPLYDGDLEAQHGIPAAVAALKERVAVADGLLLVTPEYNHSIPGVFKNAIDWMTRPASDIARVFGERPVGLIGATPGGMGTTFSQTAWLPVFRNLGARVYFGRQLYVAGAENVFNAEGALVDDKVRTLLSGFMAGFAEFVAPS